MRLIAFFTGCAAAIASGAFAQPGFAAGRHPTTAIYLNFSGDNQYVEIPSAQDLGFGTEGFTVSAWLEADTLEFKRAEGSGYVYWMGKGERNQQEWALRMYSYTNSENPPRPNRISFYLFNLAGGLGQGSYSQDPVRPGDWIHIAAVAYQGDTAIYRNGEYVRCDEYDGPAGHGCQAHPERIQPMPANAPLRLGTRDLKSFFQGGLAEVRIWNRALSAAEIRRLYASNDVPGRALAAEFLLDEGSGNVVHDSTGKHEGVVFGAKWMSLKKKKK